MRKKESKNLWQAIGYSALLGIASTYFQIKQSLLNQEPDRYRPEFSYNVSFARQDSIYAQQLAEMLYEYQTNAPKEDPLFVEIPHDSVAAWKDRSVQETYYQYGFLGARPREFGHMVLEARQQKKRYVMLTDYIGESYVADTSDLKALDAHKERELQAEGLPSLPLYVEFMADCNAYANRTQGPLLQGGVYLNIGVVTRYEKGVIRSITDHEIGHIRSPLHEKEIMPTNLYGHETNIPEYVQYEAADETFCDKKAAEKPGFKAHNLAGMMLFLTTSYINDQEWRELTQTNKRAAVKQIAATLFDMNKSQIKTMRTHPPAMYRILNMAQTAKMDIVAETAEFNQEKYGRVPYRFGF